MKTILLWNYTYILLLVVCFGKNIDIFFVDMFYETVDRKKIVNLVWINLLDTCPLLQKAHSCISEINLYHYSNIC